MPSKTSVSFTPDEASATPDLFPVTTPDESPSYDSTQDVGQEDNSITADSDTSSEYIPYTTHAPLHATTSVMDVTTPSTLSTNASFVLPNPSFDQLRLIPAAVIIGVVVGVFGMLIGFGLILSYRRREKETLCREDELDIEGANRMSGDSELDSYYVLQKARTQSVEFKKGLLISIPSRGRVASAVISAGPLNEPEQQ